MAVRNFVIVWSLCCSLASAYTPPFGPLVVATKGEVWPKPQQESKTAEFFILRPSNFEFKVVSENCNLLRNAILRYYDIINATVVSSLQQDEEILLSKPWKSDDNFVGYMEVLHIVMKEPCDDKLPTFQMREGYNLTITSHNESVLSADTIWGILRGLETFSQLLYPTSQEALQLNCTTITDYPRFSHRGLLIDTSRHFIPVPTLIKQLVAMSYNKLNVLHWHITDDQSFPYQSVKYPELSEKGAFTPSHVYSQEDIQKVINYAGARAIRVVVEFDTPGHTRSWGESNRDLLTPCYDNNIPSGLYGPVNPIKNSTYEFLTNFFQEVVRVFPDIYLHLGGDEVGFECWDSNPDIQRFMKENNMTNEVLEGYYIGHLLQIAESLRVRPIVWEEVFANGVNLPTNTAVHVWRQWLDWKNVMQMATQKGHSVILSACYYLDHLETGGDWKKYYQCDPYDFGGNVEQKKLVLGGEACMWGEVVNEYNIESRIWPRASAAAAKFWSAEKADEETDAAKRLEEHTCRMNKRGIAAQPPSGPGYCLS